MSPEHAHAPLDELHTTAAPAVAAAPALVLSRTRVTPWRYTVDPRGSSLDHVDWTCWSVVLLKPDCVRRLLDDHVVARLSEVADIHATRRVRVADWQVFVHYWDLLVDADCFDVDVPACLRTAYVGRPVVVALAHGSPGTPERLRSLLGHYDPSRAADGTIRGDLGIDSLETARSEGRLVENLVHTSDDAHAAHRDFGIWFGASQGRLLSTSPPDRR